MRASASSRQRPVHHTLARTYPHTRADALARNCRLMPTATPHNLTHTAPFARTGPRAFTSRRRRRRRSPMRDANSCIVDAHASLPCPPTPNVDTSFEKGRGATATEPSDRLVRGVWQVGSRGRQQTARWERTARFANQTRGAAAWQRVAARGEESEAGRGGRGSARPDVVWAFPPTLSNGAYLSGEVFEDGRGIHSSRCADALADVNPGLEEPMDAAHGELEPGTRRARLRSLLRGGGFTALAAWRSGDAGE